MKRKIRTLIKQGWHLAEVPRTNLYKIFDSNEWGDDRHFREICEWCNQTFESDAWYGSPVAHSGTPKPGIKRFVFKYERDRTMFLLKWN